MTKTELIDKVSSSAGITKAEAGKTIDTTLKSIEVSLKKGAEGYPCRVRNILCFQKEGKEWTQSRNR